MININFPDSINKVKVYLLFTYFLKDNIFHPILEISDTNTGVIDIGNTCYQLLQEKTIRTKKSFISQRSKIKAFIAKMICKGVYDYNVQIENLQTTLTIKALAFIGYFTPFFHHTDSKSSSTTITKPISTRTQLLLRLRNKKAEAENTYNVSSSASVKKFIENIENAKFNNDKYSLKNNNCQTFCKTCFKLFKKNYIK